MSRTKIEQYPNSLMTVSKLLADRMFQDTPTIEKAKKINQIERENFYKDKEKDKDNVDEFINKLVKIDGYITEITIFFDNSDEQLQQRQKEREAEEYRQFGGYDELDDENRYNESGDSTINGSLSSRASGSTSRTVGSGIKKRLRRQRLLRGGAGMDGAVDIDEPINFQNQEIPDDILEMMANATTASRTPSSRSAISRRTEKSEAARKITTAMRAAAARRAAADWFNDTERTTPSRASSSSSVRNARADTLRNVFGPHSRAPSIASSRSGDYFGYAPSEGALSSLTSTPSITSTEAQRRIANLQLMVNRENAQRDAEQRARDESGSIRGELNPTATTVINRRTSNRGSEIGRDAQGRPFYREDLPDIEAYHNGGDGDGISSGLNFKNLGIDKKQITYIFVILTKILEEISSINQFYKSKIFKKYKNISYFDIEMINDELITLYNKWNDLLNLMATYSFIDVKKMTDKINIQFSKLYNLTKQINPSLSVANMQKQQFEVSVADELAQSQKIRRENIHNRMREAEDQMEEQENWGARSVDSIDNH
jgi:hypothetical protein